jgi:glycosyltransferase involved in cell wall biosynthesis
LDDLSAANQGIISTVRVGILTVQVPFIQGGAELHAHSLRAALRTAGHDADIISIPFKWFPPNHIAPQILAARLLDVTESSGMSIDRVIGLKFPAYLIEHPNKVLWILHQHRSAYDLWGHGLGDLHGQPGGTAAMQAIRESDKRIIPCARRIFTNSRRVSERLLRYNGIDSEPLYHPPPLAERYICAEPEDFLLMPSRINDTKRQTLVVQALFHVRTDVRVRIVGRSEGGDKLEQLLALAAKLPSGRVRFEGAVDDKEKIALYARCLAVLFVPFDEDYGYVTLEAMLAGKPVLTCTDSGGVLEFAVDGETALVSEPDPIAVAEAMDRIWADRPLARRLGEHGRARYDRLGISWSSVVETLLG